MRSTPDSLIANEGYELAWTKFRQFFNQPLPRNPDGSPGALPAGQIDPTNEWEWLSRGSTIYIPNNVSTTQPVLLTDNYRNLLIIQNNATATAAGDIAPNLFVALDGPVVTVVLTGGGNTTTFPINGLSLAPGESVLFDTRILTNALYVAWGNAVNTGGSVLNAGVVIYGRTPNSPPLQPTGPNIDLNAMQAAGLAPRVFNPNAPLIAPPRDSMWGR